MLGNRPSARILLEASTESEWVAQLLEDLGHEVIVGGPELRAHVRDPPAPGEDGPAGCPDAGGGPPVGRLPLGRPGVGFQGAHQFEAFLGLVPGERSSDEKHARGRITKAGNVRTRYLFVEAGWRILRSKSPDTTALRAWTLTIAARPGKRIAVVALARRLAGIVFGMWRDGAAFDATRCGCRGRGLRRRSDGRSANEGD